MVHRSLSSVSNFDLVLATQSIPGWEMGPKVKMIIKWTRFGYPLLSCPVLSCLVKCGQGSGSRLSEVKARPCYARMIAIFRDEDE